MSQQSPFFGVIAPRAAERGTTVACRGRTVSRRCRPFAGGPQGYLRVAGRVRAVGATAAVLPGCRPAQDSLGRKPRSAGIVAPPNCR